MARLAISKGFLAEYAKLEKSVQSAVESAMAKFAEHTHAGLHLEKLQHSRDDRIRTIRVDSSWRGVVLAPETGDTYCLITVLPHDKANAYATSHRFSVNQALGVLEVRDEEAIQQLQPSLQAVARPDEKRLFADTSDGDLTKLGVDAQILPLVRLLTSEAHLEALQTVLPDAQYAALFALACGMTVEEAWAEVAQLLPVETPAEQVDPGDLVSAMERTPGQVAFVSGYEELQRILAYPFAAWRTFLHPAQRKIAWRPSYTGPAQVTGGAGTGKTVTALHRTAFLAERAVTPSAGGPSRGTGRTGPPILMTTFTRNLAEALDAQLALLIQDATVRSRVEVLNVDRLAYSVVKQARGAPAVADERALRQRWAQAAADAGLDFSAVFLKQEWEQVILAQDLYTEQAYLTCLRAGRGRPLSKAQRGQVWQAAQRVTIELATARQSTHLQLANEATNLLRESRTSRYQHVIVDEAQDLHPAQWRLLRAVVPPGPDDLFMASDPHQRIYDNRVSLSSLGIQVRGRSRRLSMNYRTTQEILAWAVPLLGSDSVHRPGRRGRFPAGLPLPHARAAPADPQGWPPGKRSSTRSRSTSPTGWVRASSRTPSGSPPGPPTWPERPATRSRLLGSRPPRYRAREPRRSRPGRDHARHEGPGVPGGGRHRRGAGPVPAPAAVHPRKRGQSRARPGPAT